MKNLYLKTFICVTEAGSFNKAADKLYLSPTSVIKQINQLETELEVPLFERTHRGLSLTAAGTSLYSDAKYIIDFCRDAIERAQNAMAGNNNVIRVGTSPMTPPQTLSDLWPQIHKHFADISFQLVPFENTRENAREILQNLGQNIDVVTGIVDSTFLNFRKCSGLEITRRPLCCSVSIYHSLAKRDVLTVQDLYGKNLMMIQKGWSQSMDTLREELMQNHSQINIIDFDFYDLNVFNHCEQTKDILVTIGLGQQVHPMMKEIPVEWNHSIPYGLLYSTEPSEIVQRLLKAVKLVMKSQL